MSDENDALELFVKKSYDIVLNALMIYPKSHRILYANHMNKGNTNLFYNLSDIYPSNNNLETGDNDYLLRNNYFNSSIKDKWMITIRFNIDLRYLDIKFWSKDDTLDILDLALKARGVFKSVFWYTHYLRLENLLDMEPLPKDSGDLFKFLVRIDPLKSIYEGSLNFYDLSRFHSINRDKDRNSGYRNCQDYMTYINAYGKMILGEPYAEQ